MNQVAESVSHRACKGTDNSDNTPFCCLSVKVNLNISIVKQFVSPI